MSIETTTGMSAPPIAMTMCTPKANAISVISINDSVPPEMDSAPTKAAPSQMQSSSMTRLIALRPFSSIGLLVTTPLSLPNAMTEPVKVTAPIRTPR